MNLPDIPTSVAFWAGVATLVSALGAWWTYVATSLNTRRETLRGIQNLLVGLNAELDFIKAWASGDEGDPVYVVPQTVEELMKKYPEWFNPSQYIFAFRTPTLQNFTMSPYVSYLTPIVKPLVTLNYAFQRLHDFHADYRAFVNSNPSLYANVLSKVNLNEPVSQYSMDELDFRSLVFDMNRKIHCEIIGGEKSLDQICLYKAYRSAKSTLEQFESTLKRESQPWGFWILHIAAAWFAVDGLWQVLRWFSLLK